MLYQSEAKMAMLPDMVIENIKRFLDPYRFQNKKIFLAPHCDQIVNLFYRGYFKGFEILGTLDADESKANKIINGLKVSCYDALDEKDVDFLIIVNLRVGKEIHNQVYPICHKKNIRILNAFDGYDHTTYRKELAKKFDFRNLSNLRSDIINMPKRLTKKSHEKVQITIKHNWGLGDHLCALTAAREVARRNPNLDVYFNSIPEVVELYQDQLVKTNCYEAFPVPENYNFFHREKNSSPAGNYLGCYFLGLGLDFDENPLLELPEVEPLPNLANRDYIALQPSANWARPNLNIDQLCEIINNSPIPVILTGSFIPKNTHEPIDYDLLQKNTELIRLAGADDTYVGSIENMLRIIAHAAIVLTPRSASAHIAAGYQRKTIVWIPSDGENWHLDYPLWDHIRLEHSSDIVEKIISIISNEKNYYKKKD